MTDNKPQKSLAEQFADDTQAVEAEYQAHRVAIKQMFPGLWEVMMDAATQPPEADLYD